MTSQTQESTDTGNFFDPSFLEQKAKRLLILEQQLQNADSMGGQNMSTLLCEEYSSLFLGNPLFALNQGLADRLWRNCFYERIAQSRNEISRVKRKNMGRDVIQHRIDEFHKFLNESITLYSFLIKHYLGLIVPELATESQQSQGGYDLTQNDLDEEGKSAVVAILQRFEIYLGDLYRYMDKSDESERHYARAALLAPGHGNPYNQMAVLQQLKDSTCNALYWYARSIKASRRPFETSVANVERLFQANRKYLEANPTDIPAKTDKKGKNVAASKRFNASFVNLHFHLRTSKDHATNFEAMDQVLANLRKFLSSNGIGDTLLCRMVLINAFTVSESPDVELAKVFVLKFGTELANRVQQILDKLTPSLNNPPSIRGLAPLLLTCDYVSSFNEEGEGFVKAELAFWSNVCKLANKVESLVEPFGLMKTDVLRKLPKEYKELVGFTPFQDFIDAPDEYVSFDEARGLLPQLMDTGEKKLTQDSSASPLETRIRLSHFLSIMHNSSKVVVHDTKGYHAAADSSPDDEVLMEDEENAQVPFDVELTNAAEQLLVYKAPERGVGPALLVPGTLLVGKAAESTPDQASLDPMDEDKPTIESPTVFTSEQRAPMSTDSAQGLVHPSISTFTPPLAQLRQATPTITDRPASLLAQATSVPQVSVPPGLKPPPGILPPPGFASTAAPQPQHHVLDFLSQFPTANPFMASSASTRTQAQNNGAHRLPVFASYHHDDPNAFLMDQEESSGLLDSSLLRSLWTDDSNTPLSKNPFLTHMESK
jgi:tetratricopeptide (TPR) repeat protein